MMLESPKSLTATVYVRFHYKEPEAKAVAHEETERVGIILDKATEMEPALREILIKFADYLDQMQKEG